MTTHCTLGEAMIYALSRTVEDGTLVFHGFGSPLVQLALHLAKRTHAPNLVLVAGATYGVNPTPPFLSPTSNDWVMDRGAEVSLRIDEAFDLAASGRMDRMFLSGLQIDPWGNANVTLLGQGASAAVQGGLPKLKLPGGGGGCNLSCDAGRITLWTAAHRAVPARSGKRFRLVPSCDFVTSLGHRAADGTPRRELGHRGEGPDWLITELGVFDFDAYGYLRLRSVYPDTTPDEVYEHTGFAPVVAEDLETVELPTPDMVTFLRSLDSLGVHLQELRLQDRERRFDLAS